MAHHHASLLASLASQTLQVRLTRRFRFKEFGFALFRAGETIEGHKACCAAARSAYTWRDFYAKWVSSLVDARQRALADAVAELGAKRGAFEYAMQRPASLFVRGLLCNGWRGPWYDPALVQSARLLVDAFPSIAQEYRQLLAPEVLLAPDASGGGGGDSTASTDAKTAAKSGSKQSKNMSKKKKKTGATAATREQEVVDGFERYPSPAVARGEWSDYMLVHGGQVHEAHLANFPTLQKLLTKAGAPLRADAASMVVGSCFFSRMRPGTHLRSHCGPTNLRLRVHLGIDVPSAGAWRLRVGDEAREWKEGECLVFDDSYEHEVWHEEASEGTESGAGRSRSRVVLIVDVVLPRHVPLNLEALGPRCMPAALALTLACALPFTLWRAGGSGTRPSQSKIVAISSPEGQRRLGTKRSRMAPSRSRP